MGALLTFGPTCLAHFAEEFDEIIHGGSQGEKQGNQQEDQAATVKVNSRLGETEIYKIREMKQ